MPPFKWQRILVPTDFSAFAESAVGYAHGLAELTQAELHVVHVAREASEITRNIHGVLEASGGEEEPNAWLASLLGEPGTVRRVEVVRISEDVPGAIAAYARKAEADLVVIASHGRTGLRHLLMGSVAEELLRRAPCPVLVLRPEG